MGNENLYQREGVYWLCATVRGKKIRESLRTSDVKVARKIRDRRLVEIKAAAHHGETRVRWTDAVTEWAAHAADQIAPTTAKRYAVSLLQCEAWLRDLSIRDIDGPDIQRMVDQRRKTGATAATVRRDLTAVSRVLEFAEAKGWREGNPTLSKRRLLKERRDPIALPQHHEIEAVIAAASAAFAPLIRAAWLTGCRQGELVAATWRGFNARARTLEIVGKGNKRRVIDLSADAVALIASRPRVIGCDLIFPRDGGVAYAEAASDFTHVRRAVAARAKAARTPFKGFRFHDLRHLFAVEELRRGTSIYDLSRHLGHTSVKTTEIYLAFLTTDEQKKAKRG